MIILRNKEFTCAARRGIYKKANLKYNFGKLSDLGKNYQETYNLGTRKQLRDIAGSLRRGGQKNVVDPDRFNRIARSVEAKNTIRNIREKAKEGVNNVIYGAGKNTTAIQAKRSANAARRQALQEGLV